ncbi:MAG: sulfatase, partial [Acidobacteria bacterium]
MNCQDYLYRNMHPKLVSRRWFFEQCGIGLGAMVLGHLLADAGLAASATQAPANPRALKKPHYTP